jgi:broad specificity phosphatase PhoE
VSTTLFVVRHGRTALNADGRLRGHIDVPLDDVGAREAAGLAELFAHVPLAIVVTSPLIRARATGEAIATAAGTCLATDDRLVDRDYGTFAGETRASVEERFGSLDAAPGVEPSDVLRVRALTAVEDLVRASRGRPCLLVAHDAINRVLLTSLVPELGRADHIAQPTGCWSELRHDRDAWAAVVVGATPGDGELPSM